MANKYFNVKTTIDGVVFDSKKEAARYQELKLLARAGKIDHLELQPVFLLTVNGQRIGKYIADFRYFDCERERTIIEDAKGMRTDVYKLKKKLVQALYNIEITEV
jgi:hypothetical protein